MAVTDIVSCVLHPTTVSVAVGTVTTSGGGRREITAGENASKGTKKKYPLHVDSSLTNAPALTHASLKTEARSPEGGAVKYIARVTTKQTKIELSSVENEQ